MVLVHLLPYSLDLNPIEEIWKATKRKLSPSKSLDELKKVISKSFHELTQRISFAEKRIEKFLSFGVGYWDPST